MGYTFFDHTGDVGLHLQAPTLDALFHFATEAFCDTVVDAATVEPREQTPLAAAADDVDLLLAEWLSELLYLFEAQKLLPGSAAVRVTGGHGGWRVEGVVRGERFDPSRHHLKVLIKAVTYHALDVRQGPGGWAATVIFDI